MVELINLVFTIAALIIAVMVHELAHGWVAYKLGDNTAKFAGRLTLNPIQHADPVGSLILPAILFLSGSGIIFGWAKPVPVNFNNLRHPQRDLVLVASAGIIANFLLAGVCGVFIRLFAALDIPLLSGLMLLFFIQLLRINIILALFNFLPIPPLDGSKIFFGWIQKPWAQKYVDAGPTGMWILLGLILILPLAAQTLHLNIDFFYWYLSAGSHFLLQLIM